MDVLQDFVQCVAQHITTDAGPEDFGFAQAAHVAEPEIQWATQPRTQRRRGKTLLQQGLYLLHGLGIVRNDRAGRTARGHGYAHIARYDAIRSTTEELVPELCDEAAWTVGGAIIRMHEHNVLGALYQASSATLAFSVSAAGGIVLAVLWFAVASASFLPLRGYPAHWPRFARTHPQARRGGH